MTHAVSVVVDERTFGRQLPALLVPGARGGTPVGERFEQRDAAVFVGIRRWILEGSHKELGEGSFEFLSDRIRRRDDDASGARQMAQKWKADRRRVDEDDTCRDRKSTRLNSSH